MNHLITKYNRPGPRYTSYPPVPFWNNTPDETTWMNHLKASYDPSKGIDLYVHVPFCESLCYYCGCNRTITKDHGVEDPFIKLLLKEWNLYQSKFGFTPKVHSLHFGGGTPTFLSPENLDLLIKELTKERAENFIGSIEVDPRTCSAEHLSVLKKNRIERVSLGIQDFDPEVQKAIHRHQSVSLVEGLVSKLREEGFKSLNFDLIYGLPRQTKGTISGTIETVIRLQPDLIAFYSYAHLPDRIKNQKLIKEAELPSPNEKRALYELGKKLLRENGYEEIGMDHFARPGSYLYEAMKKESLHRNFMGYVDKKSPVLLGLGPTSISDSSLSFMQNEKNLRSYEEKLNAGKLPVEKGHTHSREDLLVQEIILDLMCKNKTSFSPSDLPYTEDIIRELQGFIEDGILEYDGNLLTITNKAFVRNVAMSFDFHLRKQTQSTRFSQTI